MLFANARALLITSFFFPYGSTFNSEFEQFVVSAGEGTRQSARVDTVYQWLFFSVFTVLMLLRG